MNNQYYDTNQATKTYGKTTITTLLYIVNKVSFLILLSFFLYSNFSGMIAKKENSVTLLESIKSTFDSKILPVVYFSGISTKVITLAIDVGGHINFFDPKDSLDKV